MISMQELNPKNFPTTPDIQNNLNILLDRVNQIRTLWNKPMIVTSGLRSVDDQKRIYAAIAKRKGLTTYRVPMGSQHLKGSAADIADEDGSLKAWTLQNVAFLESIGLWCEAFESTPTWVHYQTVPPASGARFFKP